MSTDEQADSLDVQERSAKKFIKAKGWKVGPIYRDEGLSRAEFVKRAGLRKLVVDATGQAFDAIVCRDDDRIGGDMYRTGVVLMNIMDAGVRVFYYQTDTEAKLDDPTSRMIQAVKGYASEVERLKVSERTREDHQDLAAHVRVPGGWCYGYTNERIGEGKGSYVVHRINEREAEVLREVFGRFADGDGVRSIVKDLNRRGIPSPARGKKGTGSWSPSCIWAMLRRDRYRGVVIWGKTKKAYRNGTKVRLKVPPEEWLTKPAPKLRIISEDLWTQCQAKMEQNRKFTGRAGRHSKTPKYLLTGLGRCSECGGPMQVHRVKQGNENVKAYVCAYYRERASCTNTLRRPVATVDAALLSWLQESVLRENTVLEVLKEVRARLKKQGQQGKTRVPQLERQAKKLEREIKKLGEALLTTDQPPEVVVTMLNEREEQLREVRATITASQTAPSVVDLEVRRLERDARAKLADLQTLLSEAPSEARKALEAILDGSLTFTPITTEAGKRYEITGKVLVGNLIRSESVPSGI